MSTEEFIIGLFVRVDDTMSDVPLHPQGELYPSEIVTIGLLYALKGGGQRAFDRWLTRDDAALCPFLPERTRLFRLMLAHRDWTRRFLATPTVLGVADTYCQESADHVHRCVGQRWFFLNFDTDGEVRKPL